MRQSNAWTPLPFLSSFHHNCYHSNILGDTEVVQVIFYNSPVLQSARPRAVALASYTGVDKIIKNTVGFTHKDIWID